MENKNNKEFRISEEVELIARIYQEETFLKRSQREPEPETDEDGKKPFMKPNPNLTDKAFQKICKMYNKDNKARNFIKHLIINFLPHDPYSKIVCFPEDEIKAGKNVDCLLNIKLAGIKEISDAYGELGMLRMKFQAKAIIDKREKFTDEEIQQFNDCKAKYPIEVIKKTMAYSSETSDKYLCIESIQALLTFTQECIMRDVRDIMFLLNKKRVRQFNERLPKKKQLNNKQINEVSKANAFDMSHHLSPDTLQKLKEIHNSEES